MTQDVLSPAMPAEILAALDDPDRVSPMLAGPCVMDGNRLSLHLADGDITVQAERRLFRQIAALCDGTRTQIEILDSPSVAKNRDELERFMAFLFDAGILIDANRFCQTALRYARQTNPYGKSAEWASTGMIARRFSPDRRDESGVFEPVGDTPLDALFESRNSAQTFAGGQVEYEALKSMLWSMCGVVSTHHERLGALAARRTVASAGAMHLLKLFVVLRGPTGPLAPGVYRVLFPTRKTIHFEAISEDAALLPRAFIKPWFLTFAAGAVFMAGDATIGSMRYRNRAVQYLFSEAGAALHNGGLVAPKLGLGFLTFGGYYESVVEQMCRLEGDVVLGSAMFGNAATESQRTLLDTSRSLEFGWSEVRSEHFSIPHFLARARIEGNDGNEPTWGRDADPWNAYVKSVAEAVERQGFREPSPLEFGKIDTVADAIAPEAFLRYGKAQLNASGFPFSAFDPQQPYAWVTGVRQSTGQRVRVVSDLVHPRQYIQHEGPLGPKITAPTSSGCAAHADWDEACARATLELIERDAFMRHWFAQRPGVAIRAETLPAAIGQRLTTLHGAGCQAGILWLDSPYVPCVLAWAQHEERGFTAVGGGCALDVAAAVDSALSEAETLVFAHFNDGFDGKVKPQDVLQPIDHANLYGQKRHFRRADGVLRAQREVDFASVVQVAPASIEALYEKLAEDGRSPLFFNITPQRPTMDQGRTSLRVCKALIPGLIPISFGRGLEPRGMVDNIHPSSKFPHPFP